MALNETLQTTPPMLLRDYGSLNPTEQRAIRDVTLPAARERVGGLAREEASKTIAATRLAEQTKATELRRMATQGQQQIEQAYGEMREPEPFVAPRQSPEELASTAFGDLIASLMVGGIAKASAISQLQAIKGMQDARVKNDQIAVDNAYRDWEMAEKQKGEFNKRIMDKLKKIQELMPYNKDAAMAEINLLKPELNEGIAQLKLARGDLQGAIDAVEKQQVVIDKRKAEMDKLQFQRQTQMDVARLKADGKTEGRLKITAQPEARLSSSMEGVQSLGELEKRLQIPEVKKAIDSSQFFRTLLESPKEMYPIEKLIRSKIYQSLPKEAQEVFVDVAMARNDYYRQISGQAVTGSEAARNFFATLQPTDDTDTMLLKIGRVKPRFERNLIAIRDGYEIPAATEAEINRILNEYGTARPTSTGPAKNFEAERQEANAAIAQGAPRDAVAKRFKERTGQDL